MDLGGLKARKPKATKRGRARILVYGPPKNGKTYGLCGFKNALYIDAEGGALEPQYQNQLEQAGSMYVGPEEGSQDHEKILTAMKALSTSKHKFTTIIYDSLSKLFDNQIAADTDRMATAGRDMDKTFGAEKKGAIRFVRRLIRWADMLDMNLILVCHSKDKWENGQVTGTTFDGWPKLEYELHVALNVVNRKAVVTASRYEEFPKGSSFDWNYSEFSKRYGSESIEATTAPAIMASPEQVVQLEAMLAFRKDSEVLTEKWLKAADADSFADMKADDISKCINYLSQQPQTKPEPKTGKAA